MRRILVILKKEWDEIIRNRTIVVTTVFMPFLFIIIPFALTVGLPAAQGSQFYDDPNLTRVAKILQERSPEMANMDKASLFQVYIFRQFLFFLLLIPTMSSMAIATYSIIGEKQNRSLEPLLATPITVTELLLGKSLAAAGPAILVSWIAAGLYSAGILWLGGRRVFLQVINPMGLAIIFIIAPLVAVLGLSLGVVTSSRSNDPRSAQQIGVLVVLPIIGLIAGQASGIFFLTLPSVLVMAVGLGLIDATILMIGIILFQRETILTRWK
jgi:ABC-2 type transport system permease protein